MPDERQTPAERPPKKRMSRGTRVLVIIVCVLLAIALLLVATVLVLSAIGRDALTDDDGMNISRDDVESLGSGTVRYNDRLYRYNTDIVTILLMGVDEQVKQDASGIYGNANQSDANILAVLDLRNKEMTLISISRDAMCTLDILDSAGEHVGTATAQLALAYAYGDGAERSCELTSAAVSRLFYDLPIPVYGSIYMQGIRQLVGNEVACLHRVEPEVGRVAQKSQDGLEPAAAARKLVRKPCDLLAPLLRLDRCAASAVVGKCVLVVFRHVVTSASLRWTYTKRAPCGAL